MHSALNDEMGGLWLSGLVGLCRNLDACGSAMDPSSLIRACYHATTRDIGFQTSSGLGLSSALLLSPSIYTIFGSLPERNLTLNRSAGLSYKAATKRQRVKLATGRVGQKPPELAQV